MGNTLDCAVESGAGEEKAGGEEVSGAKRWNSSISGAGIDGDREILEPVGAEAIQADCRLCDSECVSCTSGRQTRVVKEENMRLRTRTTISCRFFSTTKARAYPHADTIVRLTGFSRHQAP